MIVQCEKELKTKFFMNQMKFNKNPEVILAIYLRGIKRELGRIAILVVDSDDEVGRAEFSLLCLKFQSNPIIRDRVNYLDRLISKATDFDVLSSQHLDKCGPFDSMINKFERLDQLIRGTNV